MNNEKEIVVNNQTQEVYPVLEQSIKWMLDRRNKILEIMRTTMKEGVDYGRIAGIPKPTLLKSGAEKLCSIFMLSPTIKVTDLSTPTYNRYMVTVDLVHQNSGVIVASGIGECSTNEEKYKWRAAVCDEEYDNAEPDMRRIKYKRNGERIKQVRTEPADIANTVLKMAKKRALNDAVLTATAASDIFTQDVEDMPKELIDNIETPETPNNKYDMPKPKSTNKNNSETYTWSGLLKSHVPPTKDKMPHKFITTDGLTFDCFDKEMAERIVENNKEILEFLYVEKLNGKYINNIIKDMHVIKTDKVEDENDAIEK